MRISLRKKFGQRIEQIKGTEVELFFLKEDGMVEKEIDSVPFVVLLRLKIPVRLNMPCGLGFLQPARKISPCKPTFLSANIR